MEDFEKGAKRKCTQCSTLFFDFGKFPIICPKPLHLRTNKMKPITKNVMDLDDEDEFDLQELIDELESELEDDEEIDTGNFNEDDIRKYVRELFRNKLR